MSEIHGAVGSYVVNALDLSELDEFEAHLAVCPTCTREVVEFCETAAELSLLAPVAAPPPNLRSSILSAIKEVRPLPPEVPPLPAVAEPGEPTPRRALPGSQPPPEDLTRRKAREPVIDELAVRRQRRRARVLAAAVAAVAAVALALGGVVYNLNEQRQAQVAQEQLRDEQERQRIEQEQLKTELLAAPDARILRPEPGATVDVTFVVSEDLNRAMVVGSSLPDAGPGNRYQLWTIEGANPPVPNNQFDAGPDSTALFSGDIDDKAALAVSVEDAGIVPTAPSAVLAAALL